MAVSAVGAAMFGVLAGGLLATALTLLATGWIRHRRVCDYCQDRRGWLVVERSWHDRAAATQPARSPRRLRRE